MTNRRCWQRPALFLAGCALVGCWIARSNSTTNDAEQHHPKARVPATRWGRMPLDPADSEHVPRTGDRWNFKVHADKPTSRDELWRRLSPRTSIGASVDDDVVVRVIVGYRNADGLSKLLRQKPLLETSANAAADLPSLLGLSRVHALASAFRFGDLHALVDDPDVAYIDLDSIVSGAEHRPPQPKRDAIPVGMYQVQNGPKSAVRRQYYNTNAAEQRPAGSGTSSSGSGATGPCLDEKALRVAIVDSGVDLDHPDLPCHLPQTCIGRDFTGSGAWDAPDNDHGTYGAAAETSHVLSLHASNHSLILVPFDRDARHGNSRRPPQRCRRPRDGPRPCLRLLDRCQGPGQEQSGPHVSRIGGCRVGGLSASRDRDQPVHRRRVLHELGGGTLQGNPSEGIACGGGGR